jgi:hypothetical protein
MLASVLLSKHLGVHAGVAMGQKRDETVKHDRLRTIMQTIVEQSGGKLRPVLREAGIDVETKEGRTAYQAINRWLGGREGESGDYFPRSLKLEYRELLFKYIRIKHRTEYIKPLPPGETWITSDEMATWLEDFYNSGQPGEPVQEWTKDVKRVFDETFGIEADALAEKVKKAPKKQR